METFIKAYLIWQVVGIEVLLYILFNYCYDRWISKWVVRFIDYLDEKFF